ncbi:hypothetical protein [Streptosporangium sp. NPDC000095]|uniref:hypothetical protein n=1 Tax=unclassified Streptosporangium TaxID=2632669 RepID=UPI00368EE5DB
MIMDALWRPVPASTAVIAEPQPGIRDREAAGDATPRSGHGRPARTAGSAW